MAKYLFRSELRDKYRFFQAQIEFHQNQLKSADRGYYARKAARIDEQIKELTIQRDELLAKQTTLTSSRETTETKIAGYQVEKSKIAHILSPKWAPIYKMLDELPIRFHDRVLVAILKKAEDDSIDLLSVLEEIYKEK